MGDREAEAEIERIERIFADIDFKVEEVLEYVDPDEFVSFNLIYTIVGKKAFEEHLRRMLASISRGTNEILRLEIHASGEHGYANSLQRMELFDPAGTKFFGGNVRTTICYRKRNGRWLQILQHASFPLDLQTKTPDYESKW